ncbi:HEAT repeat domain-containing protein [Wenzhouxiangella sp. XN24]|uniref:HEAT repeat domain-containing protein n=1 Tax=Wenzhouxiangella sp. XN24 TaxID=2713569 RepID=UPI0013EAE478|nr:HEAT repeat domain-containing protein [Wenzhouxiangella sp. XN24]NGX15545.1 protein kinase [Wenzhouxiangella sp. XN24]
MSLFGGFVADRLVGSIRSPADLESPAGKKAVAKLRKVGGPAVVRVVAELESADKERAAALSRVLGILISVRTLPDAAEALRHSNARGVQGLVWALSHSRDYNPNKLLDYLADDNMPRAAILEILEAQKERLEFRPVLTRAYQAESIEKAALFRLIGEMADESMLPELIGRLSGKDVAAKVHIIEILSRFDRPEVRQALGEELSSEHKLVRQTALGAIGRMGGDVDIGRLCALLMDPDLNVQNRAVDVIIKQRHPDTLKHLVEVLKSESDFARRAAVEVLNEIGDQESIKDLLGALGDDDWWVRARATDALARIGGPRVIDAVLGLISDPDESVRRAAVEILNTTKDERAVQHLIKATRDSDWWVRDRSADALGEIGDPRAVPALVKMLSTEPRSVPAAVRAIAKLAGKDALPHLLPLMDHKEAQVRVEVMAALAEIADPADADSIIQRLAKEGASSEHTVSEAAASAIQRLSERMGSGTLSGTLGTTTGGASAADASLADARELRELIKTSAQQTASLDITKLEPGDVIEGRYKYIRKIGKGAFGTVLLVEDMVVDERLVLKFLNPGVAADEEMMKRFVHELRYSRKITHPNVIRIYDFIALGGLYAISMEYFASHPLTDELKDEKPLPLRRSLQYSMDIATGMQVAHQAGVIHRDLKPANVLIDDNSLVKVVDFGVAAARASGDTQLTRTGYVIGSPKYMAPEQILGKKVDEKADVYSLGVMLYEMLTGFAPYTRGDHMSVMYQHVQGKAKRARDLNPNVPQELSDLVARCMAVDKSKRYPSMDELRAALLPFVGREN